MATPLTPHPDRQFPADPAERPVARRLHALVAGAPLICPHGHVNPQMLADDIPFSDPASLFITPDHYVTRLLHASGVPLADLGVGRPAGQVDSRAVWRTLCEHWGTFAGTVSRQWLEAELHDIFGIRERPCAANADDIHDAIAEQLASPAFRPRALYRSFGIEVLATTDDPCDDLAAHRALADDPTWDGRVIPSFRPDPYLDPQPPFFAERAAALAKASGIDTGDYAGYIAALEQRRRYFIEHGATSADHGVPTAEVTFLPAAEAERLYREALRGRLSPQEQSVFRHHMLGEMARMSAEDGLVMTIHPGSLRNHHRPTFERYGADTGHDIPVAAEYTRSLRPLLERFGTHPGFRLVLFTLDETLFSREIAPLAGFYPSVYIGAPWWFLDAPHAIRRFREAVTETAGFARSAGFVDDTRAFCSIPARHDLARRTDASYLAGLVARHVLGEDEAAEIITALTTTWPRQVWRL